MKIILKQAVDFIYKTRLMTTLLKAQPTLIKTDLLVITYLLTNLEEAKPCM
jgi:hypothetical protein